MIDAHLPKSLFELLKENGFDSIHTLNLPDGNFTTDKYLLDFAHKEDRVIVSKDGDFLRTFFQSGTPKKLLLVKTGNIKNSDLLNLFKLNIQKLSSLLIDAALIEIDTENIIVHS